MLDSPVSTASPPAPVSFEAPAATPVAPRPLRIVFVVQRGTLLRFALLIPALAERGHNVHIALASGRDWSPRTKRARKKEKLPPRTLELAEELHSLYPKRVTYGPAPKRSEGDPWSDVAWMVRGLADLAHNAHQRYASAPGLRDRTKERVLERLTNSGDLEPLARRLTLRVARRLVRRTDARLSRSMLARVARLEDAIPTSPEVDEYVRSLKPDVVVATGTFRHISSEVEFLKSARKLGIPNGIIVSSWDSLTNKGALKFKPDRVFVWNDVQAHDTVELHGVPRERVRPIGAHAFDEWFARRPSRSREQLLREIGLEEAEPYVVYLCSSFSIAENKEPAFIERWIGALRSSDDDRLRRIGILVRPHPSARKAPRKVPFENIAVWPKHGAYPVASTARADFFDTLFHAAAVVGVNTTAMIEAAIVGKSVLTILVPDFAQETTLHFPNLLKENGGFLHVAADLGEHVAQLRSVLDEDEAGAARRRRFVEAFVRPHGIEQPAAPIAARAIEELAELPADTRLGIAPRLLRLPLALEAGLIARHRRREAGGTRPAPRRRDPGRRDPRLS
jgi:hypothetical protein